MGCVYFDQKQHHAGCGYGYVGVSRFKSRAGVHLYGKLRRTDFLPVGDDRDDEVLERGYSSANTSDDEEKSHAKGLAAMYGDESSDEGASNDEDGDEGRQEYEYLASLGEEEEDAYLEHRLQQSSSNEFVSADWE